MRFLTLLSTILTVVPEFLDVTKRKNVFYYVIDLIYCDLRLQVADYAINTLAVN